MMGRQTANRELFVMIGLDEYVSEDQLPRAVDRYLDLNALRENLEMNRKAMPEGIGGCPRSRLHRQHRTFDRSLNE